MLLRCLLGSPWDGNDQKEAQENNCIFILALFKEESIEKQLLSHFKPSVSLSFVLIVTDHHHSLCIQTAGCRLI